MPNNQTQCNESGQHCEGFKHLIGAGIWEETPQMITDGKIINVLYYWVGPKGAQSKGMFAQFCPCCGGVIAETKKFLEDMEARSKNAE